MRQSSGTEAKMRYVIAVLAVCGIAVSALALAGHYDAPVLPIDVPRSHWNSAYVNQSSYSEAYGIPVAMLGIVGYALLVVLALLRRKVLTVYFGGIGLAYALYLTGIEANVLYVWSEYCVSSLILIILIEFLAMGALIFNPGTEL
jgi:vitamin-K-epoxide reductase (warfarin-sensitive)